MLSAGPNVERTSGWIMGDRCYLFKLLWFDHKTGSLVKCTRCTRVYHQDCTKPAIANDEVDAYECYICCGGDAESCHVCTEPFTKKEVDDRDSLENNELVCCNSCNEWYMYHQACHRPAIYPLPIGRFICCDCVVGASRASGSGLVATAQHNQLNGNSSAGAITTGEHQHQQWNDLVGAAVSVVLTT